LPRSESVYLIRGSLLHVGLAHFYQRIKDKDNNPDQWYGAEESILKLAELEGASWLPEVQLCVDALRDYISYWSQDDWIPLEVEYELRARLPHPVPGQPRFLFTQRADLIIEDGAGKVWIVDHKTASRINSGSLEQYIMSGQMVGYQHFGRALYGERFAGVILNRVKLYAPREFDRCTVPPAPVAVAGFVKTLKWAEYIDHTIPTDPMQAPMATNDGACYGKYGKCDAFDRCRFG
tara:strand:- start:1273 stop:1977 length:705 start_codon:yes stop_codon:yes gene_type:complete